MQEQITLLKIAEKKSSSFKIRHEKVGKKWLTKQNECVANLKISFATDSRINGSQKSGFSEIKKTWDKSKKHFYLIL
ncbi:hypothetical protein ACOX9L_13445 [Enterococcus durans]|uniref:hypothetical protein n=1 Tax=Enterococcus durans TaxID=53345 RepID=UPI0009C040FA|nr:hypothetical protein [Enterococcus durans]ASV94889.1 hypothetical protein CJZ72_04520 [Enterococcus durans]MCB8504846.1 hypothetical protein [Enterococcus durans]MCB8515213.1 hypothetical protein [Enterococcus durans]OQO78974.1 hypothetical protein BH742_11780 [Enterococcus durans]RGW66700.1 hypothetical protein DWV63_05865 [Enterococcus durans]